MLKEAGIKVVAVYACIGVSEGVMKIENMSIPVKCVHQYDDVIDEVCERDFYPGVSLSGRLISGPDSVSLPYLLPYGNPGKWASIPDQYQLDFSKFCWQETKKLFSEIEKSSGKSVSRGAKSQGGLTVGVTYCKGKDIWDKEDNTDVIISTGIERGGGREFVLVNSCDAIIIVSEGSGTSTEAAIAYQANIPIIALSGTGGWADKLADTYIDSRNRVKVRPAKNAQEAVSMALSELA